MNSGLGSKKKSHPANGLLSNRLHEFNHVEGPLFNKLQSEETALIATAL